MNSIEKHMDDCERYGMSNGCNLDCPTLKRGECELEEEVRNEQKK